MNKTTIILVDDHTLVRETWSFIINAHSNYMVIGEADSGEKGVELAAALRPDVAIMDINLPGINGIEATERLLKLSPDTRVLGVSLHTQPTYARKMMQKGATGYVTKNSSREEMFLAIEKVARGEKYICTEIKNILSDQVMNEGHESSEGIKSLSEREIGIISYIKKGMSSKEIGDTLSISVKTVEVHRYNILKKLNLKNAAALVNYIHNSAINVV